MKKTLLIGIVALSAAASSYGQGIIFGNYNGGNFIGAPISYAASNVPTGKAGLAIGSDFSATLSYFNTLTSSFVQIGSPVAFFGIDGNLGSGAGYWFGGGALIPGWTSGAVTIRVDVANTVAIGSYGVGTLVGSSGPFSITPVVSTNPNYPDFSTTTYSAFTVAAVPEPSTFALAGLGLASLLIFRRRK